jgi:hypothetical protein
MRLFNGNPDGIRSVKNKEPMHKVVAPRPSFFPRTYAKIVASVKGANIVQELCTTGTELCETYIIQRPSREIDLLPKTENSRP